MRTPLLELLLRADHAALYLFGCGFGVDPRGVWIHYGRSWPREFRWLVLFPEPKAGVETK